MWMNHFYMFVHIQTLLFCQCILKTVLKGAGMVRLAHSSILIRKRFHSYNSLHFYSYVSLSLSGFLKHTKIHIKIAATCYQWVHRHDHIYVTAVRIIIIKKRKESKAAKSWCWQTRSAHESKAFSSSWFYILARSAAVGVLCGFCMERLTARKFAGVAW